MSGCNLPEADVMPEPLHWFDVILEGADELMLEGSVLQRVVATA